MRKVAFVVPLLLTMASCGGAPQAAVAAPAAAPTPEPAPAPTATVAADKHPDMSPVGRPKTLFLLGRFNGVSKSIDSLDRMLKLSSGMRSAVDAELKQQGVGDIVYLPGSVDLAIALNPRPRDGSPDVLWAYSIPAQHIEAAVKWAKSKGWSVRTTSVGTYRIKLKGDDGECDLTPALGDAPARAVCSDTAESLKLLTPWMARGLAAEPKRPEDAWVRLDFAPLKDRYLPELKNEANGAVAEARSGLKTFLKVTDPDLLDALGIASREAFAFADDAEAIEMALTFDASAPQVRFRATFAARSETSWVTKVGTSAFDHPEGPPPMFYRLPKDASSAFWGRTYDPAQFTGIRKILHKGLNALFAQPIPYVSAADKQSFLAWVDAFPATSGTMVSSTGLLPLGLNTDKTLTSQQAVDEAKKMAHILWPWAISGLEGDPAPVIAWLKQTEDVTNRTMDDIRKAAPKDAPGWLPVAKFTRNPPGYPRGSAALDFDVAFTSKDVWEFLPQNKRDLSAQPDHPKGPEAKGKVTLRVLVVPDTPGHFWLAYSTDPDALRSHINMVLIGAPVKGQLAARTDLEPLKSHKGLGGFMSYGSWFDLVKATVPAAERPAVDAFANALPHKLQGVVYVLLSSTGGNAPVFSLDMLAGKDTIDDLSAAFSILSTKFASKGKAP